MCVFYQVTSVSQEDVDAYLSQCVCLGQRSSQDLQQIKVSGKIINQPSKTC